MIEVEIEQMRDCVSKFGYEFEKFIGFGSSSSVSLCKGKICQQQFAIKRSSKQITSEEYNSLVSLSHPNVISLYNIFNDEEYQYLVMEYCSNGTIAQHGKISPEKFIYYAKQMLEALVYCHSKQVSHFNIKPENILIDQYNHVKLCDFGIPQQNFDDKEYKNNFSSMVFSAPEILQHKHFVPFQADIWALGVTFYYIITGDYPFKGSTPEKFKESILNGDINYNKYNVDTRIRFLINKMTSKNPAMRPTAENILKLPIFSSEPSKKTLILADCGRKNGHILKYNNRLFLSIYQPSFLNETPSDEKKNNLMVDSNCYKSIIASNHISKINCYHPIGKPE